MAFYHEPIGIISLGKFSFILWDLTFILAILLTGILAFLYVKKEKWDQVFFLKLLFFIALFVSVFSWYIPGHLLNESLSSFLGIFVGSLVAILYVKWSKKSYKYLDSIVLFLPIGFAIARVGCFFNWCCMGAITDLPWGVVVADFPPMHPTQIYLIIMNLVLFGVFFYFRNHKFFISKPGNLTLSVFASYSFFRLVLVEPLRRGLEASTRSSNLAILFCITLLILYFKNRNT